MQTWKSEQDLLVDQTLALLKAAMAHQANPPLPLAQPAGAIEKSLSIPAEIVDENARERDPLVEHTLSMIERVADASENGSAREVERRTVADEISRMALELDRLRQRVASFKETQQRFQREREATHPNPDDRS